jgi:PEP-CTERM motif
MKARVIFALLVVITFAQHAAAQSLATTPREVSVPEPATGLLLGLSASVYGLYRFLHRD